jgi:hypothetical protein
MNGNETPLNFTPFQLSAFQRFSFYPPDELYLTYPMTRPGIAHRASTGEPQILFGRRDLSSITVPRRLPVIGSESSPTSLTRLPLPATNASELVDVNAGDLNSFRSRDDAEGGPSTNGCGPVTLFMPTNVLYTLKSFRSV